MSSTEPVPSPSSRAKNTAVDGSSQPTEPTSPGSLQLTAKGPGLVYIVENDHISSVITEMIVKKNLFGGQVQCYTNGQRAFDELVRARQAETTLPDLIVLDLDMPLMDGWEFLDALAALALPQPIRVFVLTSSIDPDDQDKALVNKGVSGFFTKPLKDAGVARMYALLQEG